MKKNIRIFLAIILLVTTYFLVFNVLNSNNITVKNAEVNNFKDIDLMDPRIDYELSIWIFGGKKTNIPQTIEGKIYIVNRHEAGNTFVKNTILTLNAEKTAYIVTERLEMIDAINDAYMPQSITPIPGYSLYGDEWLENTGYTYVSPTISFTATKQWQNGPIIKPNVTFDLYRNGIKLDGQSKVVSKSNNTVVWTDLPENDFNGNPYRYSVDEQNIPKYIKNIINNNTILNTYIINRVPFEKTITVVGGPTTKPTVNVKVINNLNNTLIAPTLNLNNTNRISTTVPETDDYGNILSYRLEIDPVTNYNVTKDTNGNITLTYVPPTGAVVVNKVFSGGSTTNRPSVTLQVKKNGVLVEEKVAVNTGDNINYRATFNLPRTENNGSTITYTVDEKVVPTNYTKSISGMTVTNTYVSPKTQAIKTVRQNNGQPVPISYYLTRNGVKVVGSERTVNSGSAVNYTNLDQTDNNGNAYTYNVVVDTTATRLPEGYTFDSTTNPTVVNYVSPNRAYTAEIPINGGNKNSIPSTINISILNNLRQPAIYTTATLNTDKTAYILNHQVPDTLYNGNLIEYSHEATTDIPNYTLANNTYNYVIPNGTIERTVGRENGQPQTIIVELLKNGQRTGQTVQIRSGEVARFTNQQLTNENGVNNTYTISVNTALTNGYSVRNNNTANPIVTYTSPKKNFTIEKVWQGGDTLIPDTIEVKIKRKISSQTTYTDVRTVTLRKSNNWQLNVTDLDNTDSNANVYDYIIEEVTRIANFTGSVNNFRITNTYTSPNQTVTKQVAITTGGTTKPTVKVVLVANGQEVTGSEQTVNLNDTNTVNWENKPTTNNDGTPITYTLKVKEVVTNPNNNNGTYTITNDTLTFVPHKITVNGSAQIIGARALWQDVVVVLFKNGIEEPNTRKTITVSQLQSAANNKVTFNYTNLDKVTINNQAINYQIRAITDIPNFNKVLSTTSGVQNIVYTYNNETTNVPYTINVVNGPNTVPSITVRVKETGQTAILETKTVGNNTTRNIAGTFENRAARDSVTGTTKSYTVEIVAPTNYQLTNNGNNTFTLTYVSPKTTVTGTKQWENGPSVKPAVTFDLYRNNVKVEGQSKVVPSSTNRVTWDNLDQTDINGNNYTYSVDEQAVTGYTKTKVNATTIKNTYVVNNTTYGKTISVVGGPSVKPTVEVKLKRNGQLVVPENKQTINLNTTTNFNFTNLPSTDLNGNTYTYDVEVQPVTNYNVTRDTSGNVTLTYVPPTGEIVVNKVFSGGSTTSRPTITLQVKKNGILVEEKVAVNTGDNINYRATFNLPRTENNGSTITYTVDEKVVPTNYTKSISGMTVTNTYVSPKTQATKTVRQNNGQPVPISYYLTRNGVKVVGSERTVNSGSAVNYTNLDQTDNNGNVYTYNVVVDTTATRLPEGYTFDSLTNPTVVNYVSPNRAYTAEIPINGGNKNSIPNTISVNITNTNGQPTITAAATLNTAKTAYVLNHQVANTLPNGEVITYSHTATTSIPNYTLANNTYNYVSPNTTFTKLVPKENGQPISVKVQLTRDGQVVSPLNEVTVNTGENATFTNLPQTDTNGRPYVYDIKIVPNGTLPEGYTITNNKVVYTSLKTNFTIEKVWQGGSTLIPDTIEVKIKRKIASELAYTDVKTVILRKANNWQLNVTDLDKTDSNANVYSYIVEEVTRIANFTGSVNNFRITNTYTSPNQTVTKQVAITTGGDNKPTVKVVLVANGQEVTGSEQTVNLNDTNTVNWENKPTTNNDGTPITYTLKVKEIVTNPNNDNGTYTITDDTITFVPNKITVNGSVQIVGARALWQNVEYALFKNGVEEPSTRRTITVNELQNAATNKVAVNYTNLDKVTINNQAINYEIRTITNIDKFSKNVTGNNTVYTYSNETTNIPYTINIVNGPNTVPSITVRVKETGQTAILETKTVGNNTTRNITGTFENRVARDSVTGTTKSYTVEVVAPTNYQLTNNGNNTFTLTYVSPKTTVTATKQWENGPSIKPTVTFDLYRNNVKVEGQSKVVPSSTNMVTWDNLDQTDINGNNYIYSVDEQAVTGYTKTKVNATTIKNTYVVNNTTYGKTISVVGGSSVKPTVEVKLKRNGQLVVPENKQTINLNTTTNFNFTNLPSTDLNGNTYTYDVEVQPVTNYNVTRDTSGNVTLTYVPPTGEIVVNKVFSGGSTTNRPSVTLQVKKNGVLVEEKVAINTGDNINYRATFNLPRTENNGSTITYTVDEKVVPANYTKSISGMTVTNTYVSPKTQITKDITKQNGVSIPVAVYLTRNGQKVPGSERTVNSGNSTSYTNLDLTDNSENRYTYEIVIDRVNTNLPDGYTINDQGVIVYTPTTKPYTVTIPVNGGNKESLPSTINVELTNDKNLPNKTVKATLNQDKTAYVVAENVQGTTNNVENINYGIRPITNIPNYILRSEEEIEDEDDGGGNIFIVNRNITYIYEYVSPNTIFTKLVPKENGQPISVKVQLTRDGQVVSPLNEVIVNTGENATFTNLPQTDTNGRPYVYDIKIVPNGTLPEGYTITNNKVVYTSPKINFTIEKIWQGGSTLIPDTIEVKIKRKIASELAYTDVKTVILRKANNWQLNVMYLDKTDSNANVYSYIVEEVTRIANFTGSVNNFRITNTYTSPNQTVTKQVAITTGGDNKPTVKVVLVANGQEVTGSEQTVNLNDTNTVNWENKPTTNNDGTPITYTLKVKEIVTNPNNDNGTYTITDDTITFVPNKITVNGSVQIIGARALWQDVQVDLYKNGQKVVNTTKTITVSDLERANNNLVLINYPELDKVTLNNELINYEIKASTNIDKFNKNVTGNNTVYTYTSETTNVPYSVNITGGGSVPNITVRLKNGNTVVNTHNLNGQTTGTFTNVPLRDSITGNPINYTVEYTLPSEYVKQDDGSYKYVSPKKDVTANISFVNGKAPRPNVEVQLLRNGQTIPGVNNVTLQNGQASYTFTNLDKTNEQGVDYTYSINIVNNVEDYTKSYPNNLNAVLTYVQRVGEKQFTINREGGESVPVTINLVKNGEVSTNPADTKVVNTGNTVTYTNLELTDINGNTNTYNIVVTKLPEGYTGVINNDGTINVKYTSLKIDIEVNKKWVNGDTLVPNEIEVKLQRRVKGSNSEFTDVQTFTVTKDNNWSKTITNLDKTNESAKVYEYKVVEVTEIENFTGTVNNFEITNTYTSPRGNKEFVVNIVGKDVTLPIVLTKDGQKIANTEKTTTGGTVTYTNLDLTNSDGTTIDYKLDIDMDKLSDEIKNRYDITKDTNGNITVTYKPERTDITKTVSIPENLKDTLKFVEVELVENGKPTGIIKQIPITDFVNSTTNTKLLTNDVTFTNVNKTDINGNTINYDINLVTNIPGYEITKDTNGNIVIKKIIEQKDIIANVNFDGGQLRPNVVIELIKDNKVIKTIKTSSSGNINFGKQDITDEYGNTIEYTFNVQNKEELKKKNYDTKVIKNSITLEYISPKINIDYKLVLQGGVKEELPKIQVQLLQNGNPIGNTVTLDENLRYVFENMDETNKDGIKYNYSVVVIGDIQGYEVINVNNNVSILRRKVGESINTPNAGFLPYAGAENNIAIVATLVVIILLSNTLLDKYKRTKNVNSIRSKGLRNK